TLHPPGLDNLLRAAVEMQAAAGIEIAEVAGHEITIGIGGFAGLNLVLEISDGDVALHANFADLAVRDRFAGITIDDANINAGKRAANTVASYRQRLGCIRDAAISVGLREAVDVSGFTRAEADGTQDLFWAPDRAAGAQAGEIIIVAVGVIEKRLRHVGRPVKQSATLRAN